jgi:hypothetical protein
LRRLSRQCFGVLVALVGVASFLHAQSFDTCKSLYNPHDALDCGEALFSRDPLHLTFSSMPPGNGFAIGAVLEQNTHYVSPFALPSTVVVAPGTASTQQPDSSTKNVPSLGSLWSADGRLAAVFSMNGSWMTTGMLTLMPKGYTPGHRTDHNGVDVSCNKLGILCTTKVFGIHLEATHRSLETMSFYGIGPTSPPVKYVFHQTDTYGSFRAALPLTDWLTVESGFEYRQTDLPVATASNSISNNFNNGTAPGLSAQPGFAHPHIAVRTAPIAYLSPKTDDQDDNHTGPLMKHYLVFTLRNDAEYHWYAAQGDPTYSFQRVVVDSDENIQIASMVRHFVQVGDVRGGVSKLFYRSLTRACGDFGIDWSRPTDYVIKVRQRCRYGTLDLRSHIVASRTGTGSTVPFYLQPTAGGSDIDSRVSLRGFPDYRFRAPDALFVQTDYTHPIAGPAGFLVFYDAGTVGPTFSSLSFAHLRQDAGLGATLSLQGSIVAQGYLAWGAGHGPMLGFNFAKLF